jgi:NAD(P)-dependent dehydrogenase (short-subunit alcohol dehydrogenase family)
MPTYCVTGANRGLGLEFIRQIAQDASNTVIATHRANADVNDLKSVASGSTHLLVCDTVDPKSISGFATEASKVLNGKKLDYLINNAAVNSVPHQTSLTIDGNDLRKEIDINVMGPANTVATLHSNDLLAPSARIVNMTSGLGSMSKALTISPRKCATYSISKAGVNMLTVHQSGELREKLGKECVVICMDPGWVKTRMGGEGAILEPVSVIVQQFCEDMVEQCADVG